MVTTRKSGCGKLLEHVNFLMIFFSQKIQYKILSLGIQLILFIFWLYQIKIRGKSKKQKKGKRSVKNDTQNETT